MRRLIGIVPALVALLLAHGVVPLAALAQTPAVTGRGAHSLASLEQLALERHPALKRAAAAVRAAAARKLQAGLYPNPSIGYNAEEVSAGPIIRGGEHGVFGEQMIVTAGKLKKSEEVAAQEETIKQREAEIERLRVLNGVRLYFYEALGAERRVALREQLARLTREAVGTTRELYNVGAADQTDVLDAEVEAERAELVLMETRNDQKRVWQQLAAAAGVAWLEMGPLAGSLETDLPRLEEDAALRALLAESPELAMAEAGVAREESAVKRARAEWIPDLAVRGGVRYNRERLEAGGRPVGVEGFADIGVKLPIFDRNQGGIAAAQAEAERARAEVDRLRLALRARLGLAIREYRDASERVERYEKNILPRAKKAAELYEARFRQMAAAYPQVLIARRTQYQLEAEYVEALVRMRSSAVRIRGMLVGDAKD